MALADYLPANPESRVAREIARACRRYIHRFNGYSYDFVEGGEQNVMQRLSSFGFQTVFDVGANVGKWSTLAKIYFPNATFHTFEISRTTYKTLTENLAGPEFKNNNFGLSSQKTDISYKDYGSGSGLNSILQEASVHDKKAPHEMLAARVETGDGYCMDQSVRFVDFLKVDVEGAEHMVLQGFHEMLKKMQSAWSNLNMVIITGTQDFLCGISSIFLIYTAIALLESGKEIFSFLIFLIL